MDEQTMNSGQPQFCHKCGRRLLPGSQFCSSCGARMETDSLTDVGGQHGGVTASFTAKGVDGAERPPVMETGRQPDRYIAKPPEVEVNEGHGGKLLVFVILALVLALLATCIYAAWRFLPKSLPDRQPDRIALQDINQIDGCPEFYDVKFGMTVEEVSAKVEVEHRAYSAEDPLWDLEDSLLALAEDTGFSVHGLPVSNLFCSFDGLWMNDAIIAFEGEEVSFDQALDLYIRLYGPPTKSDATSAKWLGQKTVIWMINDGGDNENQVVVFYNISPNIQYKQFTFNGPEYDPCNFLASDVFHKQPSYYTAGLTLDDDYLVEEYDFFTEYKFYPYFDLMGIDAGDTAISLDTDASGGDITVCRYLLWLDEDSAADRITYIKNVLTKEYGNYKSCDYLSMEYGKFGEYDLSFNQMIKKINSGSEGFYHVQWVANGVIVTLGIEIDSNEDYYMGSVSMSPA